MRVKSPSTLIDVLQEIQPDSSKGTLRKLLKNKRVLVDGEVKVVAKMPLDAGQIVEVGPEPVEKCKELDILYHDEHIIIINKPQGMLSVPLDKGNKMSALKVLRNYFPNKNRICGSSD